ncbi:MAG: N-acetylneuraminate synthase [Candidatus Jettenia ecosi]|uniref:N-acetylneuraminate synthase n=1 Tax=Candidatus Jettenia ecosi TaxID=2494326 RepID=A0A533QKY9_9BACT|nr:MAG: N-acetylneuraminate synthase [Candidatus Jettenia ecosi]
MRIKITNKKEVYNFCEPYVIAELGSNHNGDMELAKKLIIAAKEAGADCVKFQSWSKDTIFARKVYEDNYFLKDDYRNRTDYTLKELVEEFSISEQELLGMKRFSDELGIDCTSTPFSKKEVDFVVERLNTPFIKVASMDLNNYPFLDYIAKKGLPVVVATGLSELYEIDRAIRTIENAGNLQIVILHCVSNYPPKDEDVNLNNIESLQKLYPYPVGFSDHTLGFSIPLVSVAKGACILEKHFTLDKNMFGWDHKISATPDELKIICEESKRIQKAIGSYSFKCEEDEERKAAFRRSIVTTRSIKAGEVIKESDIDFKRPGTGLPPEYKDFVIGRTAKRVIEADRIISKEDLV